MYNPGNISCDYHLEDSFHKLKRSNDLENCFSLYHINVRSLMNKKMKLIGHFKTLNTTFKVFGITETWLDQNSISFAKFDSYNSEHSVRKIGDIGGGASIYIHEAIDYTSRSDLSCNDSFIESCFIEMIDISVSDKPIIIGCIYRPPGKNIEIFNEKIRYNF